MADDANRAVLSQERDLNGLRDTETYLYIKKINWCGLQGPPRPRTRARESSMHARSCTRDTASPALLLHVPGSARRR